MSAVTQVNYSIVLNSQGILADAVKSLRPAICKADVTLERLAVGGHDNKLWVMAKGVWPGTVQ